MDAISEVMMDPFYYLRVAVHEQHGSGLYTMPLPPQFHGFACYLDDEEVPGTEKNKKLVQEVEEALAGLELEDLEAAAFNKEK
jgi:hypothetical protein